MVYSNNMLRKQELLTQEGDLELVVRSSFDALVNNINDEQAIKII